MLVLPPDLYENLVDLLEGLPLSPKEREKLIRLALGDWSGLAALDWNGSAYAFAARLLDILPKVELQNALRALGREMDESTRYDDLGYRVEEALARMAAARSTPLGRHLHKTIERLSAARYRLDRRFVNLTLLIDQGQEASGLRFVTDANRPKYKALAELLDDIDEQAAVLLGRPGSGKTTLLLRLELEQAWSVLETGMPADGPLPFFASLGGYRAADPRDRVPSPHDWLAADWRLRRAGLESFDDCLSAGRLILLLDGLNEMPHLDPADYESRVEQWRAFLPAVVDCGNTAVFSCRSLDYSASLNSEPAPVRQVTVEPLSHEQIADFLIRHLGEQGQAAWAAMRDDDDQIDLFTTPFFLRLLVDQIGPDGALPRGRAELLTGFIRRALRREIDDHKQHLFAPGELLSADDRQRIIHDAWDGPYELPVDGSLIPALEMLAYRMQDGRGAGEAGGVRVAERTARELLAKDPWQGDPSPVDVLAAGVQLNVLDKDLVKREMAFLHQLFQEYFAARALACVPEPERLDVPWRAADVSPSLDEELASLAVSDPLLALPATGWEETTLMAAAMTPNQTQFVTRLMATNLPMAARCAVSSEVAVPQALIEALQAALLARIVDPAADLRARIDAAEALGELGDPRFERREGPHGSCLLPPLAPVPAGTYTIGDDDGYDWEKPAHSVSVAAFEIGVFPVTNAEFRLFIRAGGYEDERWWVTAAARAWLRGESSGEGGRAYYRDLVAQLKGIPDEQIRQVAHATPEQIEAYLWFKHAEESELEDQLVRWYPSGKRYREPEYWDDSRFNHPARPVVGLTWFEACAYCAWLSAQSGETYSLPSEVEWEAAARGPERRVYPYGPKFDITAGNTFESHVRRTTPIGVFPGGISPEGVHDLSGNVWEWTTTIFHGSYREGTAGSENAEDAGARRVVRGGSWLDHQGFARAASRNDVHPLNRDDVVGCRVVRRPPSHSL